MVRHGAGLGPDVETNTVDAYDVDRHSPATRTTPTGVRAVSVVPDSPWGPAGPGGGVRSRSCNAALPTPRPMAAAAALRATSHHEVASGERETVRAQSPASTRAGRGTNQA
jgi:hypothetical protein